MCVQIQARRRFWNQRFQGRRFPFWKSLTEDDKGCSFLRTWRYLGGIAPSICIYDVFGLNWSAVPRGRFPPCSIRFVLIPESNGGNAYENKRSAWPTTPDKQSLNPNDSAFGFFIRTAIPHVRTAIPPSAGFVSIWALHYKEQPFRRIAAYLSNEYWQNVQYLL